MSVSFALILFGSLLIVAGWSNVSLSAAARGDNTVPKSPVTAAPPAPSSSSSPQAQGKGGATTGKGGAGSTGGSGGAW